MAQSISSTPSYIPPSKHDYNQLSKYLRSKDPNEVILAINVLLEATHDYEENYAFEKGGKQVVYAIVVAFERCIGWSRNIKDDGSTLNNRKRKKEIMIDHEVKYRELIDHAWDPLPQQSKFCKKIETILDEDSDADHSLNSNTWDQTKLIQWYQYCDVLFTNQTSKSLEHPLQLMESLIMIVRNLSFVAANTYHLAYSVGILRMLGGCLHCWKMFVPKSKTKQSTMIHNDDNTNTTNQTINMNICIHSLQSLIMLSPLIHTTGSKFFADFLLLDDDGDAPNNDIIPPPKKKKSKWNKPLRTSNQSKPSTNNTVTLPLAYHLGLGGMLMAKRLEVTRVDDDVYTKIPPFLIRNIVWSNIQTNISLFRLILECISQNKNRSILLLGLECMKEIMDQSNNRVLFEQSRHVPESFIQRLVDLLYIPRLGPDSLEYVDPVTNMVSRVATLKLANGYDASIDFEVRDRSVDILERLTSFSPDMKRRVGEHGPRLFDYLICMLSTDVGRSDARQLAGSVLANIAMVQENKQLGITYIEDKLLDLASKDANIANVVCNCLMN